MEVKCGKCGKIAKKGDVFILMPTLVEQDRQMCLACTRKYQEEKKSFLNKCYNVMVENKKHEHNN